MMSPIQELKKWMYEFQEIASYHNGDYKEGMERVLQGLSSQVNYLANKEQILIQDTFDNGQANYAEPRDYENGKDYYTESFNR